MTQAEAEIEIKSLRGEVSRLLEKEQDRDKYWRPLGILGKASAVAFSILGAAFLLIDLFLDFAKSHPSTHQFMTMMGYQFIFISWPLLLIGAALHRKRASA